MKLNLENKQKKIIAIAIIVILLIILIIIKLGRTKKTVNMMNLVANYDSDISSSKSFEAEFREKVKNAFAEVQIQYNDDKKIDSKITIDGYYNETRLNMAMEDGEIEFVDLDDIPTGDLNLYDLKGKLLAEVPTSTFNGEEVEISSPTIIENGNYYLLRCSSQDSIYTFYYVVQFDKTGTISMDWLCYTENEIVNDNLDYELDN
jgi:uncharacterized membrane protein